MYVTDNYLGGGEALASARQLQLAQAHLISAPGVLATALKSLLLLQSQSNTIAVTGLTWLWSHAWTPRLTAFLSVSTGVAGRMQLLPHPMQPPHWGVGLEGGHLGAYSQLGYAITPVDLASGQRLGPSHVVNQNELASLQALAATQGLVYDEAGILCALPTDFMQHSRARIGSEEVGSAATRAPSEQRRHGSNSGVVAASQALQYSGRGSGQLQEMYETTSAGMSDEVLPGSPSYEEEEEYEEEGPSTSQHTGPDLYLLPGRPSLAAPTAEKRNSINSAASQAIRGMPSLISRPPKPPHVPLPSLPPVQITHQRRQPHHAAKPAKRDQRAILPANQSKPITVECEDGSSLVLRPGPAAAKSTG
jgi:hypothetical protein